MIRIALRFLVPAFIILKLSVVSMVLPQTKFDPSLAYHAKTQVPTLTYSVMRTGPFEVAKVFGRSQGCQEADVELVNFVAKTAFQYNIDPKIVASTIATESQCNPLAISNKGALGMMQVTPKTWSKTYDFSHYNLLNREDNITVGTMILANYVKTWGVNGGVTRYQGLAVGCTTCDAQYTHKVLVLALGK